MRRFLTQFAMGSLIVTATANGTVESYVQVRSPDGHTQVSVSLPSEKEGARYSVTRKGEVVIASSALGLTLSEPANFGFLTLLKTEIRAVDTSYPIFAGKSSSARDHFNEVRLIFQEREEPKRRFEILFRAYDDGVAFRYLIPDQPGIEQVSISNERTTFAFAANYPCWGFNLGRTETVHEGEYDPIRASLLRSHHLYELPLTCRTLSGVTSFAIAEADLREYGALYLRGRFDGGLGVAAQLSTRIDLPGIAVRRPMSAVGVQSPWRVIMMADRAGDLIASSLLSNLNPPSQIKDTSWIKPGKAVNYWFTGGSAPLGASAGINMPTLKHYIDFAGRSGFEYAIIDLGWSLGSGMKDGSWGSMIEAASSGRVRTSDLTRAEPHLDMAALAEHGRKQAVGLILWVDWKALDRQMDVAMAQFSQWGIKGVKVDFMERADQPVIEFYHRLFRKAAEHRLIVELHSACHPTGLERTWPNLLTQEGVLGIEMTAVTARITATHNVTLPYTRMLLGGMDYTPGLFSNVMPSEYRISDAKPQVMVTRAHALAQYVVYESPLQMLADTPENYEGAAGFQFLKVVPTTWDETRFIAGEIGESIVLARRKGRDWYVGAMTNEAARTIEVPLDFLGPGRFSATLWEDGDTPTALVRKTQMSMTVGDRLSLRLAPSGGAAVVLSPQGR